MKAIYYDAMPRTWRSRFRKVGRNLRDESLEDMAQYFDILYSEENNNNSNERKQTTQITTTNHADSNLLLNQEMVVRMQKIPVQSMEVTSGRVVT